MKLSIIGLGAVGAAAAMLVAPRARARELVLMPRTGVIGHFAARLRRKLFQSDSFIAETVRERLT